MRSVVSEKNGFTLEPHSHGTTPVGLPPLPQWSSVSPFFFFVCSPLRVAPAPDV